MLWKSRDNPLLRKLLKFFERCFSLVPNHLDGAAAVVRFHHERARQRVKDLSRKRVWRRDQRN
jgi:hypothetical protein